MNQKSGWRQDFRAQARLVAERKRAEGPPKVTRADRWVGVPMWLLLAAGMTWQLWDGLAQGRFEGDRLGTVLASESPVLFGFRILGCLVLITGSLWMAIRFIRKAR